MSETPVAKHGRKGGPPPLPDGLTSEIFDSHCHLDAMGVPVEQTLAEAASVGVTRMVTVGDTVEASGWCVRTANEFTQVWATVAVHPTEVTGLTNADYDVMEALALDPRVVAIGETGLDYHWDRSTPKDQQEHFRRHIDMAKKVGKPVMIHDRSAHADVLSILRQEGPPTSGVIFHAFSGDEAMARECVDAGYVLSFSGVVTFSNAPDLRAAAAVTPLSQMLVETDSPFLTPHPHRGRPNSPYLLPLTVRGLAAAAGVEPEAVCEAIQQTGKRLFRW
jgi:TatD DNase family protein